MRRITTVVLVGALLLVLTAGVALAATRIIECDGGRCEGTNRDDRLIESKNNDEIIARDGADVVDASRFKGDTDKVSGNTGNDRINVADGDDNDVVNCGTGRDQVTFDRGDQINRDCEDRRRQ